MWPKHHSTLEIVLRLFSVAEEAMGSGCTKLQKATLKLLQHLDMLGQVLHPSPVIQKLATLLKMTLILFSLLILSQAQEKSIPDFLPLLYIGSRLVCMCIKWEVEELSSMWMVEGGGISWWEILTAFMESAPGCEVFMGPPGNI